MVRGAIEDAAASWAKYLVQRLKEATRESDAIRILGPAPAPITRIRDRYRWHLQLHGPDPEKLRASSFRALLV